MNRMNRTIRSLADIEVYVQDVCPHLDADEVEEIAERIQSLDHPRYGSDWGEWLSSLDDDLFM